MRFTANKSDYDKALENAKRQTLSHLYSDILAHLQMIETSVYSGWYVETLEEIQKLRTIMLDYE